jgi:hypothetical protein
MSIYFELEIVMILPVVIRVCAYVDWWWLYLTWI